MRILVTGGCGFIGSALVRRLVNEGHIVLNIDKLTYAGDRRAVAEVARRPNYIFRQADIADSMAMSNAFESFRPHVVFHLAAESHVDRSIDGPADFIETNVRGTFVLLDCALAFWKTLSGGARDSFRFVHISTDEVFGSLGTEGFFTEETAYAPNSPYSATKAASDMLVRAWNRTYGLPVIVSNCSNNYGPYQNREKLIPTIIRKALAGQPVPIYGKGENVRDWLFVDDHVSALLAVWVRGTAGDSYNIGGHNEVCNLDLARTICRELDRVHPRGGRALYETLITFVADRPGHDFRYAIDPQKARAELGWTPEHDLAEGLKATIAWYLEHPAWLGGEIEADDRLGLGASRVLSA